MIITLAGSIARLFLELLLTATNIECPPDHDIIIMNTNNQVYIAQIL